MKIYQQAPVDISFQSFGSAWLIIMRGKTEHIELTFNGLFNLCATNGALEYQDHTQTTATFWSSRDAMRRFFFNQYFMPREETAPHKGILVRRAMRFAWSRLARLKWRFEKFLTFDETITFEGLSSGTICAERPDNDMKDEILAHAFNQNTHEKSLTSEWETDTLVEDES